MELGNKARERLDISISAGHDYPRLLPDSDILLMGNIPLSENLYSTGLSPKPECSWNLYPGIGLGPQ